MSDDVWQSIERKIQGHNLALKYLPTSCSECGNIVEPVDYGVDPDTDIRLWATHCCGKWNEYFEKVSERELP